LRIGGARARRSLAFLCLALVFLARPLPAIAGNIVGAWSPVKPWPMIAIHAALLPDGRVMTFGNKAQDFYDVWDPAAGLDSGHHHLANTTGATLFCSSQIVLPDGTGVFVAGGGTKDSPKRGEQRIRLRSQCNHAQGRPGAAAILLVDHDNVGRPRIHTRGHRRERPPGDSRH
jgi:hypothetical protein